MSKAADDPSIATDSIDHLRRYLTTVLYTMPASAGTTKGSHI